METTLTRGEQEELVAGGAGVGCSQHNKQLCIRYYIDFNLVEGWVVGLGLTKKMPFGISLKTSPKCVIKSIFHIYNF